MPAHVKTPRSPITVTTLCDLPRPETDRELLWLFERAEIEIATPSSWQPIVDASLRGARRERGSSRDDAERRADAYHRASTIVGWLEKLPKALGDVLVAAYQPREFPHRYQLQLGRLSGVVPTLASMRDGLRAARGAGLTAHTDVVLWLDEAIQLGRDELVSAARDEALLHYARALAAYRAARGSRPSLVDPSP